ncbi:MULTISPECIES: TonB-dependent receptor plug domain-containing protein [Idiomarina]|uniref:TonB-dependent receptor plug domain-containing protein n=1 Tax=Idiomarina TaxID=135575 RepID=UPI00129B38BB|nr:MULTISPECIES: TonB-dependent receptor [Idiomarina]MRJ41270.1 TonB-dependent receptor plug domain-containing protein [Idiomarina sp. FeN1]NCU56435.1 TonB-dependent receptor plug domain-containing protein [Idiomarina sp. FenA--70]NCU59454.1 TonB-dependent receptor plug domain-containing protein [Idiomarina sp. FenBw--71]UUN12624.1 TonB-dependent receptor [Idiomarina loihiensis]
MAKQSFLSSSIRAIMMAGFGSALLAGAPAMAQDQSNESEDGEKAKAAEKIQVTGSRIRTDGLDSPTPVEIITTEIATDQGLNTLGELLRTSTVASGSDQLISAYSVGYVTNGGSGAESISMRGLGASRTLVLLNGRRAGPAGTRGTVSAFDMNALPISIIERVEILKDGASSLYGSDAVAGVINIITKKGEGGEVNFSGLAPFEGGGETYRLNATYGDSFDRGSWRVVADHNVNTGLIRADRDYFDCSTRYLFSNIVTGERADPIDPRTGEYHCNESGFGLWHAYAGVGLPANTSAGRFQFNYGGYDVADPTTINPYYNPADPRSIGVEGVNPFLRAAPDGWYWAGYNAESDGLLDGGGHPFRLQQTMVPETTVSSVFLQGDYDLTDTISAYGELLHSRRTTESESARQFWTADVGYVSINSIDGFDGDGYVMPVHYTNHYGNKTTIDYSRAVVGLEGSIGFWNWDVSYQRSHNSGTYAQDIILRDSMLMAQGLLATGATCNGEVTPISGKACYDYDWFDPQNLYGNPSQEARDFLFGYDKGKTTYKQDTFDAYITGDLFDLPAGALSTAAGIYWQRDEINDVPGENTRNGNSWGLSSAGITAGKATTKAVYAEFQVPVLRDLPFVESLDLTASGRWTDVDAYGDDTTYKLSANWSIGEGFRVRASRGTSFRAPALFELYLEGQTGFLGQTNDPCLDYVNATNPLVRENCAAAGIPETYTDTVGTGSSSFTTITGGGAGVLQAETSVSEGIGLVYESAEGTFAASVDYYDVVISNQISSVSGAAVLNQCYTSTDFANEPFCNQIDRKDGTADGDWSIQEVRGGYLNTAQQTVRGFDFVVTYQDSFDFGDLRVKLDHTHQVERSFQQFVTDTPEDSLGWIGNPKSIGTLNTTLTRDEWSFNWNMAYYDRTEDYSYYGTDSTTLRGEDVRFVAHIPTYVLHSISANTTFNDNIDVTFGIGNLFDKQPPSVSPAAAAVVGNTPLFASQMDYLGRRAFFNISYQF